MTTPPIPKFKRGDLVKIVCTKLASPYQDLYGKKAVIVDDLKLRLGKYHGIGESQATYLYMISVDGLLIGAQESSLAPWYDGWDKLDHSFQDCLPTKLSTQDTVHG